MNRLSIFFLFFISFSITSFGQFAGGTYSIGSGGNYINLKAACDALNSAGSISGDVILEITENLTESSNIGLGVNTNGYSITIRPDADADRTITFTQSSKNLGPSGSFIIGTTTLKDFSGLTQTDNIIIDGYANGGSVRRLTFTTSNNSNINNSPITIIGNSNFIIIKNCSVIHNPNLSSGFPINFAVGLYTYYSSGTGSLVPDNITVDNCVLTALSSYSAAIGTFWAGSDNSTLPTNFIIKNNTISASYAGIYLYKCGPVEIYNNDISIDQTFDQDNYGLYMENINTSSYGTSNISRNNFKKLKSVASSNNTSTYIYIDGHNDIKINIYNNLLTGFSRPISSQSGEKIIVRGIRSTLVDESKTTKILYNTILMNDLGSSGEIDYVGILFNGNTWEIIKNNIISIEESDSGVFGFQKSNNPYEQTPTCDYNLVYLGTGGAKLGKDLTDTYATLEEWKSGTSLDANSITDDPLFASETNLKPSIGSPALAAGTPVAGITTDYEGEQRSGTNPSIGAFENGQLPVAVDWCDLHSPQNASINEGGSAAIYAQVYEPGVTPAAGQGAGIECWIGWNDADTDPSTWTNWIAADYIADAGDNDVYTAEIGNGLPEGTYYYASRFRKTENSVGSYQYGGYNSNGGDFWDGTIYVSGVLTVTQSTPPYFQDFDGDASLPISWLIEDTNNDSKKWFKSNFNAFSAPNAMLSGYSTSNAANDWLFSPGFNLTGNTTYEVTFWYRSYAYNEPQKLEVKWGATQNSAGMTSAAIFDNNTINNTYYKKGTCEFTPSSSGTYYLGWHCYSDPNKHNLFLDDISILVKPAATSNNDIIAGNTDPVTFDGIGTTIQFTSGNTGNINLTVNKINSDPGGTPPDGLTNIAAQYWKITVESGVVDGTYSITLDISNVAGINNPAALHLLKRDNAGEIWTDYGVPSSIDGNFLTWEGFTSFSEFGLGGGGANPLPVELSSFTALVNKNNVVTLNWSTATEINNYGFQIQRKNIEGKKWDTIDFIKGAGNSNSPVNYKFEDKGLTSGKYQYRLKQIDIDGNYKYSKVVEAEIKAPLKFSLEQNYPNPFNPETVIEFEVPKDSKVKIKIFDALGREVKTLLNKSVRAGFNKTMWNGKDDLGNNAASGIYIYRLETENLILNKKMVLLR